MGSNPKRWVLRTFSPRLEKTDFRGILSSVDEPVSPDETWGYRRHEGFDSISISRSAVTVTALSDEGEGDVVVQARQVALSEEGGASSGTSTTEEAPPSSPGTPSSSGSHCGFYSFVDDPASPEAESNQVYMTSSERQAKLATLRRQQSFTLQTYAGDRRPERLFQETNGESLYRVGSEGKREERDEEEQEQEEEEKPDRMHIIRSQAPRKRPEFKEQWSALESMDLKSPSQRLVDGFSLCYSPASPKPEPRRTEPGAIINEQIDFSTARKQFLLMEQARLNSPTKSPPQPPKHRKPPMPERRPSTPEQTGNDGQSESSNRLVSMGRKGTVSVTEEPIYNPHSSYTDEQDSGLGDRSAGYISDESSSNEVPYAKEGRQSTSNVIETPIEREIRIAQEREESLRQERGIKHSDTSEMVEIKTKPLLSQRSTSPLPQPVKAKESNRVSFLIRREFEKENRREDSLQRQGWISGIYSHDSAQDVREQRNVSPTMTNIMQVPVHPSPRLAIPVEETWVADCPVFMDSNVLSDSEEDDEEEKEKEKEKEKEEDLSPCCPHRHPDETVLPMIRTDYMQSITLPETTVDEKWSSSLQTSDEPPWRNSLSSRDGARPWGDARPVPLWRSHLERSKEIPHSQNTLDLLHREMEEAERREQELLEQRAATARLVSSSESGLENFRPPSSTADEEQREEASIGSVFDTRTDTVEMDLSGYHPKRTSYSHSHSWSLDATTLPRTSVPGCTIYFWVAYVRHLISGRGISENE